MELDIRREFEVRATRAVAGYDVRGIVTGDRKVYPLGTDTKVLSSIFEAIARPLVYDIARNHGLDVWEARAQNSYPDFTLLRGVDDTAKLAVDVKTTYRATRSSSIRFTLGSYTSFIREGNETRGIEFPFSEYVEHWIIGYVYERRDPSEVPAHIYDVSDLEQIPAPYRNVDYFVRQKWEIAGDVAGSGNTANIGSRTADLASLRDGSPLFDSEAEFLDYWRGYRRTASERANTYRNVREFRDRRGRTRG